MTPNEYMILRAFGTRDRVTLREVAEHLRNANQYTRYLCAAMVNSGLLIECVDDSGEKPKPAYRLTPKSRDVLADLWRGMEDNLRRRVARFRRVAAAIEKRADDVGEMASHTMQATKGQAQPGEKPSTPSAHE